MAYRLAKSLEVAIAEIRSVWPSAVIGTIASAQHRAASPDSDHNPEDHDGNPDTPEVVCAIDPMDGPGVDIDELVRRVLVKPHPDLAYVIRKGKIYHRRNGFRPTTYRGSDPHDTHGHISVGTGSDGRRRPPFDDTDAWGIATESAEDDDMRIITFAGEDRLYGANGAMVGGLPVLVPLTDWPRVEQWIKSGARQVNAGVKLDRRCWHVADDDAWPDTVPTSAGVAELVPHTHDTGPAVPVKA